MLYIYLTVIIIVSIITGIILTIVEKKGVVPKRDHDILSDTLELDRIIQEDFPEVTKKTVTSTKVVEDIAPQEDGVYYNSPVMVSSYTIDLGPVIHNVQKIDVKKDIEKIDKTQSISMEEEIL
jgi:hypothetical protein